MARTAWDAELERLAAVRSLKLLDTPAEERFDRITRFAQHVFDVPIVLVSLVDLDRQWFKSSQGMDTREGPRSESFCSRAIESADLMEVPDATCDARFADNPVVLGPPHIRFYAGQPVRGPSGHRVGTLCLIDRRPRELGVEDRQRLRDLGSWVEVEYAVAAAERDRALARDVRAEFISVISHELRTPLTSIHGSLELVGSGRFGTLDQRAARLVSIAAKNTDRLIRLSNDVLDLTRLQSGLRLTLADVDVAEAVENAVHAVEGVADRTGVSLEADCAACPVRGDLDKLVQVFTNLLANAVEFAPAGSTVLVSCARAGDRVEVAVRDRGPGVPRHDVDRIFDPFVQLEGASARGVGLGLSITRGIAEAHGGSVAVRSTVGEGSTFTVVLPVAGPATDRPWW
ncbi:GAF domain-containing sensor histidine kinase [Umezawaea sp.]|uniref:GAF domain-containing sensor histidine kinase n=1 Tax=Umezawaea sp. TaxID=1955258 RepID=UPI002ED4DB68